MRGDKLVQELLRDLYGIILDLVDRELEKICIVFIIGILCWSLIRQGKFFGWNFCKFSKEFFDEIILIPQFGIQRDDRSIRALLNFAGHNEIPDSFDIHLWANSWATYV